MIKEIQIPTISQLDVVDINSEVEAIVRESGVKHGICLVFVPHATAAVFINENADPNISLDFQDAVDRAVPLHAGYMHDAIDNNAAAHIKASIVGPSETVPIKDGKLMLGRWQDIMVAEFDGPRDRRVIVQVFGE